MSFTNKVMSSSTRNSPAGLGLNQAKVFPNLPCPSECKDLYKIETPYCKIHPCIGDMEVRVGFGNVSDFCSL